MGVKQHYVIYLFTIITESDNDIEFTSLNPESYKKKMDVWHVHDKIKYNLSKRKLALINYNIE